ncbi:MAG: pnp [Gemmataceae bacterium]|nr:pnp [Gemmataceae bacterium]
MDPQQLPLTGLAPADVEVWGFNGRPTTECGYSLPILRDRKTDRFCLYSVTRPGGPRWDLRAEIEEHVRLGRVTLLPHPLAFPDRSIPSASQPVVAWVREAFWSELSQADFGAWVPCPDEPEGAEERGGQPDGPTARVRLVVCRSVEEVTARFDEWAREFIHKYDEALVNPEPAWNDLERLSDFGLCAARSPAVRYQLFTRYCAAMYYRPKGSPERAAQVFRLLVRTEFKTVSWERFCADMAVVTNRSRDLLRFRAATVAAVNHPVAVVPGGSARATQLGGEPATEWTDVVRINPELIGRLIGPGGKTIRAIQESTGAKIDIEDDGTVSIAGLESEGVEAARRHVEALCAEIKIGAIYEGKVTSIKNFGAFIEIAPGRAGLCHISELDSGYVGLVEDVVKVGDKVTVKVIAIDDQDRVKLSRKALLGAGKSDRSPPATSRTTPANKPVSPEAP